ncbi:MAG: RagB/SusD family nutrient uptake outer membrane protein [Arachidicoccus sp.]|nr:RagB/SusD family nutrient uptake outer membrane protein [Arachidicoccus sp.]
MKNIKHIAALSIMVMFAACKKDYLDQMPSSNIQAEQVFSNINNTLAYVNTLYDYLPTWAYTGSNGSLYPISGATDETWPVWSDYLPAYNVDAITPSNFPLLSSDWSTYYTAIRACNNFFTYYHLVPANPSQPGERERLKGEAFGLRAFYYFSLYRAWGALPLITVPVDPSDVSSTYYPRTSIDSIVNFIVSDLDSAIYYLPAAYTDQSLDGRVDKTMALALKSRTLLYYASPLSNPSNNIARWQAAAAASLQALDTALANGYTLAANYNDIFSQYLNQEVIFGTVMSNHGIDQVTQSTGEGGWGDCGPLQDFVDSYEMQATGLPITNPNSGFNPNHPYTGRDPRFYSTVIYPGEVWKSQKIDIYGKDQNVSNAFSGYWWRKYVSPTGNLINGTGFVTNTWVLFRTGELYLNYAEAQNEAVGPDATVYSAVNAIRTRAGMPNLPAGYSQSQMRSAIQLERKIELAFEGNRFWDVRRWEIANVTNVGPVHRVAYTVSGIDTTFTYPVLQTRSFTAPRDYLLPIPQDEMNKNRGVNPSFTQNPGWTD